MGAHRWFWLRPRAFLPGPPQGPRLLTSVAPAEGIVQGAACPGTVSTGSLPWSHAGSLSHVITENEPLSEGQGSESTLDEQDLHGGRWKGREWDQGRPTSKAWRCRVGKEESGRAGGLPSFLSNLASPTFPSHLSGLPLHHPLLSLRAGLP